MNTIEITSSEFRNSQKKYLDLVAQGMQKIFKKKPRQFDEKTIRQIELSRAQIAAGECVVCHTDEELKDFFDSL